MTETHDDVFDEIDKQVADKQNLPTTAPEIAPLPMLPIGDGQPDFLYHNFDGDKMRKWQLVAFATGSEVSSGDEWAGKEFDLKYWLIHSARINGKTPGEVIDALRTVLVSPDGEAIAFVSDGIAIALQRMVRHIGMGPYVPPIRVKVVKIKTRNGNTYFKIEPAVVEF